MTRPLPTTFDQPSAPPTEFEPIQENTLERLPRAEIEAAQVEKLRDFLRWIYAKSAFWRQYLEAAGVAPDDVSEVIMGQILTAGTG